MKNISKFKIRISTVILSAILFTMVISLSSCDPTLESLSYDLPESNSKEDLTPPSAGFSASVTDDFLTYTFGNTSSSSTDYVWDYGDGNTSTGVDGENTFPDEGSYTVTLTASDKLGASSMFSLNVEVVEPPTPAAITPEIINGDFDDKFTGWQIDTFSDGNTRNPFNSSSDGDPLNYDGSDSGGSKTPGAKWTGSTSAGPSISSSTRYAYQAINVTPNHDYFIEFSYAIKTDVADIEGGDRVIVEILDGHFTDGVDARASSDGGPLVQAIGNVANGKGNFTVKTQSFTANATGEIAIWIYGITKDELYVDNVKVYPFE